MPFQIRTLNLYKDMLAGPGRRTEIGGIKVVESAVLLGHPKEKVMSYANSLGARHVAVVGDSELEKGEVQLKDMSTGESEPISMDKLRKLHF